MNTGWVFMGEFTTNRYRFYFRFFAGILMVFPSPLIAYATQNWRAYSLWGNLMCLPLILALPFITVESPRWLIQKGRRKEAVAVFQKGWKMARFTLIACLNWLVVSLVMFGMYFDIGNLPFNIYLTQLFIPMPIILLEGPLSWIDTYKPHLLNRRLMLLSLLSIAGLLNFGLTGLFYAGFQHDSSLGWVFSVLSTLGQAATSVAFDVAYVYSIELFPTLLRSSAGALCSASARLGGIVGPQLLYVATLCEPCSAIPYLVFGIMAVFGAIVDYAYLPNTQDKALLENINEELHKLDATKERKK